MKFSVISLVLLLSVGVVSAQENFDRTSTVNDNFEDPAFQKGGLNTSGLSFLSFFEGPSTVEPGQTVQLEFENDISFAADVPYDDDEVIDTEGGKYIVEIYDCNDACGSNDDYIEGIRFENIDILTGLADGDTISGSTRYTIPKDQDGPMSADAYVWVEEFRSDGTDNDGDNVIDENDEAGVSDAPGASWNVGSVSDAPSEGDEQNGSSGTDDQEETVTFGADQKVGIVFAGVGVIVLIGGFIWFRE